MGYLIESEDGKSVEVSIDPYNCSIAELKEAIAMCENREELYYSLEQGSKKFINSVYGALGNDFYQCKNKDIAESITLQGQDLIKYSVKVIDKLFADYWSLLAKDHVLIANDMKNKFPDFDVDMFLKLCKNVPDIGKGSQIYGDTDSAYITLHPLILSCGITNEQSTDFILFFNKYVLSEYLEKCFDKYAEFYNCNKNIEEFELEKIARTVIMLKKKKYVMDISWKGPNVHLKPLHSITYKGVEIVQGSWPVFCRSELKKFVIYLLDMLNNDRPIIYSEIIKKIKEVKRKFAMQNPNDICKSNSMSGYEKYVYQDSGEEVEYNDVTIPLHVRAASLYNNMLYNGAKQYRSKYSLIHKGDKVKFYYTLGGSNNNVFAFLPNNFPLEFGPKMDIDTQFEKIILDPFNRFIEAVGHNPVGSSLTYTNNLF